VDAITISLSKELGPRKIRVNSLNPGMVETEGVHAAGFAESDFRKMIESTTPLGRIGQPDDIGKAAVFFASDDAGWVNGQTVIAAGGQSILESLPPGLRGLLRRGRLENSRYSLRRETLLMDSQGRTGSARVSLWGSV
jgi:hypothetical protein